MSERNTAIVLAAGQGKRMHSKVQKQFLEIQGYPVLYYSLRCFQESPLIQDIILVTGEESISYCKEEIVQKYGFTKVSAVIPGGKERYDSVYAGLCECRDCEYVLIHDGARPFVTEEILKRGLQKVKETGACVIGMPSKDTVKLSDEEGYVKETPNRKCVWTIQTPQIFSYSLIFFIGCDHNIDPVFKRKSVWKTFQSFSSHHYYFSTCFLTKHLHICRNTYQKLVVLADSPVFICCYDNIHLNFPLLILYCQFKSGE